MKNCDDASKKLERKAIEKNRRIHMKGLCCKLNSLVPCLSSQPYKLFSQENQFDQSTVYIEQLKKRIELLKAKKDEASRCVNNGCENDLCCNVKDDQLVVSYDSASQPTVEVKELDGGLQVLLTSKLARHFLFSEVISIVEDGGGEVVKGGYTIVDDKVIYTIHAKARVARIGVDITSVNEKLQKLINLTSRR